MTQVQARRALARVATSLAVLLPVFAWAPLTFPGYLVLHSGFLPIFNLNHLMGQLGDPAWAPLVGQPYDLWRGERALPYLLAVGPRLFGIDSLTAVKFVLGVSIVMGALGIYAWARGQVGAWAALLASTLYVLLPINLATVYVRGAFAEAVFLGLMPWVLFAARRAAASQRVGAAVLFAFLLAASFWTQAGLAVWLSLICLAYIFVLLRYPPADVGFTIERASGRSARPLLGWLGGCGLGVLGLLPVVLRYGASASSESARVTFAEHFVYPHQLMSAGWGFGPSIAGPYDTLPFQVGLVAFGLALFALVDPAGLRHAMADGMANRERRAMLFMAVGVILALMLLSSTLSAPSWRILPFASRTLTYPWQLLLLAGPWVALLAGMGGLALSARLDGAAEAAPIPMYAGLLALVLLGSYAYLAPQTTDVIPPEQPAAIFGDDDLALLRAEVQGAPGPGGELTLNAEWQALRPLAEDYTVFFHAIGPDDVLWGQHDSMPQDGAAPTSFWLPGVVMTDTMRLTLKPDAPAGADYSYPVGLYLWQTSERLKVGADDGYVVQP